MTAGPERRPPFGYDGYVSSRQVSEAYRVRKLERPVWAARHRADREREVALGRGAVLEVPLESRGMGDRFVLRCLK